MLKRASKASEAFQKLLKLEEEAKNLDFELYLCHPTKTTGVRGE